MSTTVRKPVVVPMASGSAAATASQGAGRWRRVARVTAWVVLGVLALLAALGVGTSLGRYVLRAAWEEGKILARRQPITEILADTSAPAEVRGRLTLVVDARTFAQQALQLEGGRSFTAYSALDRDTLVLVLSAARRDTLAAYTWWFPVVGRFPYKGFFNAREAQRSRDDLERRGFDTVLRPAAAFSTLGWFDDPLLSTTLRLDSVSLANTVIHELTHNTLFVKGSVPFNESFASFVGARGAAEFFRARGQPAAARAAERQWADEKQLGAFWGATARAIDSAFAAHPRDSLARLEARDSVYARMRHVLLADLAPRMPTVSRSALERLPLNNAVLLARRVYASDLWLFDEVHRRAGGSLAATVRLIRDLVRASPADPFETLRAWLAAGTERTASGAVPDRVTP
ncbi:MAG: aminopeptidase [Gemmatimonadaceae bacterium]